MKFCPYCGTELMSGRAVFCMECGNRLPEKPKEERTGQGAAVEEEPEKRERKKRGGSGDIMEMYAAGQQEEDAMRRQPKPPARKKRAARDDYDGYYDDVIPYDEGRIREDNILEVAKNIMLIILAALFIVGVCVVLMYVL